MDEITVDGTTIYAQAGAMLSKTAHAALEAGLTGMEFAAGIPGCVGGAVVMNAGAYGGEMKDILKSVTVLTADGQEKELTPGELDMRLDDFRIDALGNTHNVLGSPSHFTFLLNKLGSRRLTDRAELRSSLTLVHITTNSANKLRHNLFPPALLYFCCFIERHCCRVYNISCFPIGVKYLLIKNINYF